MRTPGSRFSAALAASVFFGLTSIASGQFISFSYEQTDIDTGSGSFFGTVDGISLSGAMPLATVTQNDENNRPLPEGMIGYLDGYQNLGVSGNDFGVHLGWEGSVTLTGSRVVSATELELVELEVDLVIADDGTPDADWAYSAMVTDDDGQGNDAFGDYRIAGWPGNPKEGHRHSGDTRTFVQGAVDNFVMGGTHGQVDAEGWGDNLGIAFSFRTGPDGENPGGEVVDGPVYVDSITWQGGLAVDLSRLEVVGLAPPADFNADGVVDLGDFAILRENFNTDGTDRSTGDLTGDSRTDLFDFAVFRTAFDSANGATAAASVPEPATGISILLGALMAAFAFRRQR